MHELHGITQHRTITLPEPSSLKRSWFTPEQSLQLKLVAVVWLNAPKDAKKMVKMKIVCFIVGLFVLLTNFGLFC